MRRYTLRDNVRSALLGMGIGVALIPFIVAEREKTNSNVEIPRVHVVYAQTQRIDLTENETENEIVEAAETTEEEIVETVEEIETVEAEIFVPEEQEPYFPYTQEDIFLVGNTVFHEVGVLRYRCSEEDAMKALRMTASCVVNRAKMNYMFLGRTIEDQVNRKQYESSEKISNTRQEDVDEIFYQIAEEILQNGPIISERLVYQSEFEQGDVVDHIDNQWFGLVPESEYNTYKNAD